MRGRTCSVGIVCRLYWLFSCFLTWQNNRHPKLSFCYFSEGLGLADLQTLDFHTMPASSSSAFFLHRCSFHLHPLGPETGHQPGPGSGKQALRRRSRWKGRYLVQTRGRGDGGKAPWKPEHLWLHKLSGRSRKDDFISENCLFRLTSITDMHA